MIEEISSIVEREEKRETFGWDLLRDKFKGRSKTFDNEQKKKNPFYTLTFFNVVKEASAVEKIKKEKPTLEKFLEKFDSCDLPPPPCVTPNAQSGFHNSESTTSNEDDDTKLLRKSLLRVSGECFELATPTLEV